MRYNGAMRQNPGDLTREGAADGLRRPTDAEVRAIAAQLAREVSEPPPEDPSTQLSAQDHELAPADEARVDAALLALAPVHPAATLRAEHDAGHGRPLGSASAVPPEAPRGDLSADESGPSRGA